MTMPRDPNEMRDVMELYDLPVIDTPFTRLAEHWCSHQLGPCADFEMDYSRCAARVGLKNVHKDCKEYLADWRECAFKTKSIMRYQAIQTERKRQGLAPKQKPPPDSVYTVHQ